MQVNQIIRDALTLWDEGLIPPGCMLWRLVEFTRWVATGGCMIRDIHGEIVPLKFNLVQRLILARMLEQAMSGQPIRIVVLKARKTGVSTFIQALYVRICQTCKNQIARTIAHRTEDTKDIFDIARRVMREDVEEDTEPGRMAIDFGSKSRYTCATGGARGVGAGGTPSLLHLSEFGLWFGVMGADVAADSEYTITSSIPLVPESIIVYESTARGANPMWDRFQAADQHKSQYAAVFVPWFYDERNIVLAPKSLLRDKDERAVCRRAARDGIELGDGNLEWRRQKLVDLGPHIFKQEFPSTPEEAIETAKGLVLPGLREWVVKKLPFEYGLVEPGGRVGGWDHGYDDPSAMISGVVWDGILWIFAVERESGLLASDMAERWTVMAGHKYYCDPSALGHRKELTKACRLANIPATFVAAPTAKAEAKGTDIAEFEWHRLRQFIANGRLRIHDGAQEQLLLEAESLFFKNGKVNQTRSESTGHFDTLDALRYMVNGVLARGTTQARAPEKRQPSRRQQLRG